jgi:hypothetical protein
LHWLISITNLLFATVMMVRAYRERRVLAFYWALTAYFGLAILFDMTSAPFGSPYGLTPVVMTQEAIGRVSLFVLGCNLCFSVGSGLINALFPARTSAPFRISERDWNASGLIWFYLGLFFVGAAWYLPQIASYSYSDFVADNRTLLSKQTFMASMPLGPLAILRKRYWLAALPVAGTLFIVAVTHVRDPLLYSAFPIVLVTILSPWPIPGRAKAALRVVGLLTATALVGIGGYIMFLRSNRVSLPEFDLTRGMYVVFEQVDKGVRKTGADSMEIALKSIFWPVYNRHIVDNYHIPDDPPYHIARITLEHVTYASLDAHFPFLWYSDVYLSMGWIGMLQGLLWGALLAAWDTIVRRNPVVWAVNLPLLSWTVYMFNRGVVAGAFSRVSPLVYAQMFILLAGFTWAELHMRKPRSLVANA